VAPETGVKGTGAFPFHGDAPGFVPARWAGYLDTAAAAGDVTAYRHYWEPPPLPTWKDTWPGAARARCGCPGPGS